jgi:PAS domain S-box-containing protein
MIRPEDRTMTIPLDLYRRLVNTVSDYAIFALDVHGNILSWNEGARRLKQYESTEILGKSFTVFYGANDRANGLPEAELETASAAGRVENEGWRIRKDGSRFWANVVITALRDDDGKLIGFAKVTRDLTARRDADAAQLAAARTAAEEAAARRAAEERVTELREVNVTLEEQAVQLEEQAEELEMQLQENSELSATRESLLEELIEHSERLMLLEAAVEGTTEGIFILGGEMTGDGPIVVYANPVAARITGYAVHELLGQHLRKLINGPAAFQSSTASGRLRLERGLSLAARVTQYRRDGSEFVAEWGVTPLGPSDRGVKHYVAVLRDVTDRAQLEEQFLQSQKMEAVGRLAGGVAHDFNNLLTIIIANARMLAAVASPGELPGALDEIRAAGERAAGLTRQLLTFSRKQTPVLVTLDLNASVMGVFGLLRRVLGEDVEITTILMKGLPPIHGDSGQMEQVLMNLAVNARDAMPDGGTLSISTSRGDRPDTVVLSVSDTGTGIDEATKLHLFEPFFTTKDVGKGTGLGLATVYGIVRQMGGEITVESAQGRGARFDITLPCAVVAPSVQEVTMPYRHETHGTGQVVLIAEDEPALRRIVRHILANSGYIVVEAENASAALGKAEHMDSIDLLVTDVVMPGMRGSALASELRRSHPALRVLFMSGYTHDAAVERDGSVFASAFIEKPFDDRELLRAVHAILSASESAFRRF